jgi:DNA-binding CsgD family transcriptional regulator
MTTPQASPPAKGRRAVKFTPQAIEKIKEFVAQGISRGEIANRLGVSVGSLQVTCSRLGISLRRIILSNGSHHTGGRTIPPPRSVGVAVRDKEVSQPAARAAPVAQFAIRLRHQGKEQTTDIPLPSPAIEVLALEAMSRHLDIAELIGQVLVAAINKDMIHKILR